MAQQSSKIPIACDSGKQCFPVQNLATVSKL